LSSAICHTPFPAEINGRVGNSPFSSSVPDFLLVFSAIIKKQGVPEGMACPQIVFFVRQLT
jgi:hypothetical protein